MLVDHEVLQMRTMIETANEFEYGDDFHLVNSIPTRGISGTLVKWDILAPSRKMDTSFVGIDAASEPVDYVKVGDRVANCLVTFKHKPMGAGTINDLRRVGTAAEKGARAAIVMEQNDLVRLNGAQKDEWMLWSMLKGTLSHTLGGIAQSIDYGIDATHLIDVSSTGPWSTAGTDIVTQLRTWKRLIKGDSGRTAVTVYHNSSVTPYLLKNTLLSTYFASTAAGERFVREGDIGRIGKLQFVEYDGSYYDSNDTEQMFIPDGYVIMVPRFDSSWVEFIEGSVLVPNDSNTDFVEITGKAMWSRVKDDPVGLMMWLKYVRLPILKVPGCVVYAKVA
jgi:hypothetical protein